MENQDDLRKEIGKQLQLDPEDMADRGFHMVAPRGEPTVGRKYELGVRGPLRQFSSGEQSETYAGHWYVQKPGEADLHGQDGWTGANHTWALDVAGDWRFGVLIKLGGDDTGLVTHSITVVDPAAGSNPGPR